AQALPGGDADPRPAVAFAAVGGRIRQVEERGEACARRIVGTRLGDRGAVVQGAPIADGELDDTCLANGAREQAITGECFGPRVHWLHASGERWTAVAVVVADEPGICATFAAPAVWWGASGAGRRDAAPAGGCAATPARARCRGARRRVARRRGVRPSRRLPDITPAGEERHRCEPWEAVLAHGSKVQR